MATRTDPCHKVRVSCKFPALCIVSSHNIVVERTKNDEIMTYGNYDEKHYLRPYVKGFILKMLVYFKVFNFRKKTHAFKQGIKKCVLIDDSFIYLLFRTQNSI